MKKIHRSKELIIKIVNEHLKEGCSYNYLAEKYNISRNTISNWLYKHKNKHSIKVLCKILNVNRANYYKQRFNNKNDFKEINIIKKIFEKHKKCYGYRRLKIAIEKEAGWIINHKKLLKLMKNYNIRANWVKHIHRKNTYRSYENLLDAKCNLLQRNFRAEKINQKWVTDITYIKIYKQKDFLYLSTIIDLYDKRIIAYEMSFKNNTELVMNALLKAVKNKKLNGLILHSDQGIQYRTTKYNKFCENLGIRISMSRKGTPLDNAVIESFHSILKKETIYNKIIKTKHDMINLIHKWMNFKQTLEWQPFLGHFLCRLVFSLNSTGVK